MGKKLDRILGRGFKASKLKPLLSLALSRLTVLKAQRQVRASNARSDVVQILRLGHHERALLLVEQVIKEHNALDAYAMMESYCNLIIERVNLVELERVCPGELSETISTLIYACSRCGDFPELLEFRAVFHSLYGKEFVARAIELRNGCAVNTKMVQKMSTLHPSLESRTKLLQEIANENEISLSLDGLPVPDEEIVGVNSAQESPKSIEPSSLRAQSLGGTAEPSLNRRESGELSDSLKTRQKYKDVADAAQAAFESANYAAAAARAAIELSRTGGGYCPDSPASPNHRKIDSRSVKINSEQENLEIKSKPHTTNQSCSSLGSTIDQHINANEGVDELPSASVPEAAIHTSPETQIPPSFQAALNVEVDKSPVRLNLANGPISVRTRRLRGF